MNTINSEEIELRTYRLGNTTQGSKSGFVKFYKSVQNNSSLLFAIDLILCNLVRFFYVVESAFCIFYLINLTSSLVYLISIVPLLVIIGDDLYVSIKRKGKEYYWFSISSFAYTLIKLITIWGIVTYRHDYMENQCEFNIKDNITHPSIWKANVKNVCPYLEVFVSFLILFLIVGRWLYPTTKAIGKEDVSELLLSFLNHGADIVDFFSYVDEPNISKDYGTVLIILALFSLSVVQFSLTLVARREKDTRKTGSVSRMLDVVFGTCIWNLVVMLAFQEVPFFITRLTILLTYDKTSKNLSLYLFCLKNITKIAIGIFRICKTATDEVKLRKTDAE